MTAKWIEGQIPPFNFLSLTYSGTGQIGPSFKGYTQIEQAYYGPPKMEPL